MCVLKWFSDSGNAALAAVAVSVISVVVSVIALRKSSRTQRRLLEIEEQREKDRVQDTQKARLVARIDRIESPRDLMMTYHYLVIANRGDGAAYNIKVLIDDHVVLEHPVVLGNRKEIQQVGPHSEFCYQLAPTSAAQLPDFIKITWTDGSKLAGEYESTLT